ncbi:MAG: hypothetical protein GX217_03065, partial [Clostridiaceae bacterium]|nr:hypothetical protein [Clostridiaceae bacterium]
MRKIDVSEQKLTYELTPAQSRIYRSGKLIQDSTSYNNPFAYYFEQKISEEQLKKSISRLAERHEVMQSSLNEMPSGEACFITKTVVLSENHVPFKVMDFSGYQTKDHFNAYKNSLVIPFELVGQPLYRFVLLRYADGDVLFLDFHHLIFDGISLDILLKELTTSYKEEAFVEQESKPYSEYALAWPAYLTSSEYKEHLDYWQKAFSGGYSSLQVAEDVPFYSKDDKKSESIILDANFLEATNKKIRSDGITLYNFLISSLALTFYSLQDKNRFLIGTIYSGRTEVDQLTTMGMFVNTLPFLADINEEQTGLDFMVENLNQIGSALIHQNCLLDDIYDIAEKSCDTSKDRWIEVAFVLEDLSLGNLELTCLGKRLPIEGRQAKFDLLFIIERVNEAIVLTAEYREGVLDQGKIAALLSYWQKIMENLSASPENTILEITSLEAEDIFSLKSDEVRVEAETETVDTAESLSADSDLEKQMINILSEIWQEVFQLEQIGPDDDYFELGGDSIKAIGLAGNLQRRGYDINAADILRLSTIRKIGKVIQVRTAESIGESLSGDYSFSGIQKWFLDMVPVERNHFNQSVSIRIKYRLADRELEKAVGKLVKHHDLLRASFVLNDQDKKMIVGEESRIEVIEVSSNSDLAKVATRKQFEINLENGPTGYILYQRGDRHTDLVMIIHHMLIDNVSWRILFQDLADALTGKFNSLTPKSDSYIAWQEETQKYEQVLSANYETPDERGLGRLFGKGPEKVVSSQMKTVSYAISQDVITHLENNDSHSLESQLLCALTLALIPHYDGKVLIFTLERHGRQNDFSDLDVSRTVGWFTEIIPLPV